MLANLGVLRICKVWGSSLGCPRARLVQTHCIFPLSWQQGTCWGELGC